MNLLFTFDQYYVQPFQVTFLSLWHHLAPTSRSQLHVYLVFPFKTQPQAQEYLIQFLTSVPIQLQPTQIHWLHFPKKKLVATFPMRKRDHVTRATYHRLFLTEFLPTHLKIDKLLYLDCDLVIQTDLTPLWTQSEYQPHPHQLLAAVNHGRTNPKKYYSYFFKFQNLKKRLGHSPKKLTDETFRYFNAGVLIINVLAWRQYPKLVPKFIRFIERNHRHILYHDQDVLNFFSLPNRCLYLPTEWNYCLSVHHGNKDKNKTNLTPLSDKPIQPNIIHYNYCYKPWEKDYPNSDHQATWDFWWHQVDHRFFPPRNNKKKNKTKPDKKDKIKTGKKNN